MLSEQNVFAKLLDEKFSELLSAKYLPAKTQLKEMLSAGNTMEEITRDYVLVSDTWVKDKELIGISKLVPKDEVDSFLAEVEKLKS